MAGKAFICCAVTGCILGIIVSIVALVFGVFACIPAGPFEERNLDMGIPFIVLSATGIVTVFSAGLGAAVGFFLDCMVDFDG